MYFKVLMGYEKNQPLDINQVKLVKEERIRCVSEFVAEHYELPVVKYEVLSEEADGMIIRIIYDEKAYNKKDNRTLEGFRDFYFSDIEFGSPRQDEKDRRFDIFWKQFMMKKLIEYSPEYVEEYFDEWNKQYYKFESEKSGIDIERTMQNPIHKSMADSGKSLLDCENINVL